MALTGEYVPSKAGWVREQVARFEATDGAEANTLRGGDDPIVVISSIGAKSGYIRKNPVMRVERDGKYLAIGSVGGAPKNPAWVENFLANPEVELQDGPDRRTFKARLLSGEERADWWQHAVRTWKTYAVYQTRTEREIPVFLLEPTDERTAAEHSAQRLFDVRSGVLVLRRDVARAVRVDLDAGAHGGGEGDLLEVAALGAGRLEPQHLLERCGVVLGELVLAERRLADDEVQVGVPVDAELDLAALDVGRRPWRRPA